MNEVNERSAAQLTVSFYDFAGALSQPSVGSTYSVIDVLTGTVLRADTATGASGGVATITLDSTDTQIVTDTLSREEHCVVIKADYGSGDEANAQFRFKVINLKALTGT